VARVDIGGAQAMLGSNIPIPRNVPITVAGDPLIQDRPLFSSIFGSETENFVFSFREA
jgi:hypothetical protein